ncbi:MAG: DUF2752 domain-containing protein [Bacteroidota bacterium]
MKLKYILGLSVTAVLVVIYYKYNPGVYDFFPECPFHKYLGLDCPGCGSQRAIHALLHGDLLLALDYNLLLVLCIPFLLFHLYLKGYGLLTKTKQTWGIWYKPATPKFIALIVVMFWIVRNIPVQPFIYLAS